MREDAETAARRVADSLRHELLGARHPPGTRLKEIALADRYQVGRYTIRAALRELVDSHLLTHETNRGVVVPDLTADRINELFDFRGVLELGSLRAALRKGMDFAAAEQAVVALEQLPADAPWEEVTSAHRRVHHAIVEAAGNPRLLAAYSACEDEVQFMLAFIQPDYSPALLASLHRDLLDELRTGEAAAVRALSHDLEITGRRTLLRALDRVHAARKDSSP